MASTSASEPVPRRCASRSFSPTRKPAPRVSYARAGCTRKGNSAPTKSRAGLCYRRGNECQPGLRIDGGREEVCASLWEEYPTPMHFKRARRFSWPSYLCGCALLSCASPVNEMRIFISFPPTSKPNTSYDNRGHTQELYPEQQSLHTAEKNVQAY